MKPSGKTSHLAVMLMTFVCWTLTSQAAELNWREQFDQGLIQEEVHQDLEKAAEHYQSILTTYDDQRDVLAMSMYRLAETLRKLGRIDEAAPLYKRIVREFPDKQSLVLLSQRFVPNYERPMVNPLIIANDEALMNHPQSLNFVIDQIKEASPDEAMQMLVEFTKDILARDLLGQYRIAQAELAQLRTKYKEKWPPLREQQLKVSTLEEQMKIHADKGVKLLEIRLTALMQKGGAGTGQTSEDMTQNPALSRSTKLVDQAETLRVLIAELEKASTDVALQLLKKEADIELPADLLHKKLDAEFELSKIKEKHPLYAELKAKRDFIYDQLYESVQTFIEQLRIKLRVLEGANKPENQVTDTPSLLDKHETLKLFIEELEKAPSDLAIQMLIQETDDIVPENLLNEKSSLTIELEGLLQGLSPAHPRIQEQKAKLDSVQNQMKEVVEESIEQLKVKLGILERTSITIPEKEISQNEEDALFEELLVVANDKPDLLIRDSNGNSRPHQAAGKGYVKVLQFFIDQGIDVNLTNGNMGRTMLHSAVSNEHIDAIEYLLGLEGINVNQPDAWEGETTLHLAAQQGHLGIVKMLIDAGANVNQGTIGRQPHSTEGHDVSHVMDHVIVMRQPDDPQAHILDPRIPTAGGTIYSVSKVYSENLKTKGNTPLHLAAQNGLLEMCSLLIKSGADVNARNACQLTPFFNSLLFSTQGHLYLSELFDLLVENGADPNIPGIVNLKHFSDHALVNQGLRKVMNTLRNNQKEKTLHKSYLLNGSRAVVEELSILSSSKQTIPELPVGWKTPLHIAVLMNDSIAVKLLENGADINQQDDWGRTPVHDAFLTEDSNFISTALDLADRGSENRKYEWAYQIDPLIKDYSGYRPLDFAALIDCNADSLNALLSLVDPAEREQVSYEVFWNTIPFFNFDTILTAPPDCLATLPGARVVFMETGPNGATPMEFALESYNIKFANWLLNKGVPRQLTPRLKRQKDYLEKWLEQNSHPRSEGRTEKQQVYDLLTPFEEQKEAE